MLTSPGVARTPWPPPQMDTVVAVWCGERKGRCTTRRLLALSASATL
jgi:hypothetical protein